MEARGIARQGGSRPTVSVYVSRAGTVSVVSVIAGVWFGSIAGFLLGAVVGFVIGFVCIPLIVVPLVLSRLSITVPILLVTTTLVTALGTYGTGSFAPLTGLVLSVPFYILASYVLAFIWPWRWAHDYVVDRSICACGYPHAGL